MDQSHITVNLALIIMFAICIVLVSVDILEIRKIFNLWKLKDTYPPDYFGNCIRADLLVKTGFSVFSMIAALSALSLVSSMLISIEFLLYKFFDSFLYINYLVFGLYMFGFTLVGLINWNSVAYLCDKSNPNIKIFNAGNVFSLIGCFVLAIIIILGVGMFEVINFYEDSIRERRNGSKIMRRIILWYVYRREGNNPIRNRNEEEEGILNNNGNVILRGD